jgi:TctA family transporter
MIEAAIEAFGVLMDPSRLMYLVIGVLIGFTVGFLPGIGGTAGMALLLPLLFGMDPYAAMALMIGVVAVNNTADTFTSVLFGIPGSASSQATIMDGHPLARRGEAARALSASFIASMIGGVVGALVLLLAIPIARPLVLSFRTPDLFMLTLFGLSMISLMVGKRPLRGILVGALGLVLGTVGGAAGTPEYRYTFGWLYLYGGVPLPIAVAAFFAIPELITFLVGGGKISRTGTVEKGSLQGAMDALRNWFLILRSSALGAFMGIIPGLGGSTVEWLTYYLAKATAKDKSQFGKGDIRGVVAPESCNNAKDGGSLIPTLLFNVPTSGSMAVLLGGLTILGVEAGPRMVTTDLPITITIVWSLALANILGTFLCFLMARPISMLTTMDANKFAPFLIVLICVGAYQSTQNYGDFVLLLGIGMFSWLLRVLDWPRIPFIIGFVLSDGAERYLFISMSRYGYEWLTRPTVLIIGALIAIVIAAAIILNRRGTSFQEPVMHAALPDQPGAR